MPFLAEALAQPQEALRLLDIASGGAQLDILMAIESEGKFVEGEVSRKFDDGKKRDLPLLGYHHSTVATLSQGFTVERRPVTHAPFVVARKSDAASAQIAQLFYSNASKMTVTISVYKSGGDATTQAAGTPLEFVMKEARIGAHVFVTGGPTGGLNELIAFEFRGLLIQSAPQRADGTIGPIRTCEYTPRGA